MGTLSVWIWALAVLAVIACGSLEAEAPSQDANSTAESLPVLETSVSVPQELGGDCTTLEATPLRQDGEVVLEEIGSDSGLRLFAAEYPLPDRPARLWSQWGQGVVASTGMHYSGVGDHEGPDGNSYLFEYDPDTRRLTRVMDIMSLVDHQSGAWGYGKLHSQMVTDSCGSVWLYTYWGTRNDLVYGNGYEGDLLLHLDAASRTVASHGPVAGRRGVPSLAAAGDGRYVVAEAVEPSSNDGDLVVFDTEAAEVTSVLDDPDHVGFRSLAVDTEGRAVYTAAGGDARLLDPSTGESREADFDWPADGENFLRAATPVAPDGSFYGVMSDDRDLFSVDRGGNVSVYGGAGGYTTSLAMTPDGDRVFWLPNAHGSAWEDGASIRVLNTRNGEIHDLVALREPFERELGLLPGGTYSISYHDGRLILGVNASPLGDDSGFGAVVLVVVEGL